jgi:CRISPR-associated protein Cas4
MAYKEEEFLMLSGLQHFTFCRRRWALIHIEQQWAENYRTVDGAIMHKTAHDKDFFESRGDRLITRGMAVFSATLGVSGECDVLEFLRSEGGITLAGRDGTWQPYPVEYKRGSFHSESGDALQLCGQAMCLEEMLCCDIPEGALYFGETRRRTVVPFMPELREQVKTSLAEMHELYRRSHTPKVKPKKSCQACSLVELCLPKLARIGAAGDYLRVRLEEEL